MGQADDTSAVEAFRIYREFKKIQREAGITAPDPTDKEAIRKGLYGDGYDKSLAEIEKSRSTGRPR